MTGIITGIVVVVGGVASAIVFLMWRNSRTGLRIPDMSAYRFTIPNPIHEDDDEYTLEEQIKENILLDRARNYEWATRVLYCAPTTEADSVSRTVMFAFEQRGEALSLLMHLITFEVSRSSSTTTLFRNNSIAKKCFRDGKFVRFTLFIRRDLPSFGQTI
jgi:hypothetical protein